MNPGLRGRPAGQHPRLSGSVGPVEFPTDAKPIAPGGSRPVARRRLAGVGATVAVAAALLIGPATVTAAAPWWQLAGFPGQAVTRVAVVQGRVVAVVNGRAMAAGGSGFTPAAAPPPPAASVTVGATTWSIDSAGRVLAARNGVAPVVDPGSPDLGAGANLIAAPAALPGVVVAVSVSGQVWRRTSGGSWSLSLVLLPDTLVTGTPRVTGIAAFNDKAVSGVVYLGTEGYGTLLTTDGGDDWVRADPGLPDAVLSLVANDSAPTPAVWAGTSQGLYVHRLQGLPAIPTYSGGSLTGKWLITVATCLVVTILAALTLVVWSRRRPRTLGHKTST